MLSGFACEAITLQATGDSAQRCEIKNSVYMGNHWEIIANWGGKDLLINATPDNFNPTLNEDIYSLSRTWSLFVEKE